MKSSSFKKISNVLLAILCVLVLIPSGCEDDPLDREKFLGTYTVSQVCVGEGSSNYTMTISAGSGNDGLQLTASGPFTYTLTATVSGSNLTIPQQLISGGGESVFISGNGTLSGNILTITLQVVIIDGGETDQCILSCTKN
jgi:hypothetical protein